MKKITQQKSLFEYYHFSKKEEKKYPVITKILKELTPERIEKEIKDIQKIKLPPELQKWVKEYEKVGDRNPVIWTVIYKIIEIVNFPIATKRYQKSLQDTKFLLMMFVILLDDPVDKMRNKKLIVELLKIPFGKDNINLTSLSAKERQYLKFAIHIWNSIDKSIKKYPLYKEFKEIFLFDIMQILNSMNFAFLVNKNPYLINKTEYWAYFPCSMQVMAYRTLDLMCSPKFDIKKLGIIRTITWEMQNMIRIDNWISTWEREIQERDYTSGIIAYSIDSGLITVNELKNKEPAEIITRIKKSDIEKQFLKKWEQHYNKINELAPKIKFLDVKKFLSQLETTIIFHLIFKNII
jgi:hypothetical protein